MYLSRIILDASLRETMQALANPNRLHGAVASSFTGEHGRVLWRIDWLDSRCCLLIVSDSKPDLTYLAVQFGAPDTGETKLYDTLLQRLQDGQRWRFRLCANPTVCASAGAENISRGKVYAHVTQAQQRLWLNNRAAKNGFSLDPDGFDVVHSQWLRFHKGAEPSCEVTLLRVTFEGTLTVTDAPLLKAALIGGIGREKAYGCGMLTLAAGGEKRG